MLYPIRVVTIRATTGNYCSQIRKTKLFFHSFVALEICKNTIFLGYKYATGRDVHIVTLLPKE